MRKERFHTIPDLYLPSLAPESIEKLAVIAKGFDVTRMRFTPGGQIGVSGLEPEDLPQLQAALEPLLDGPPPNRIGRILACPGCNDCKYGIRDTEAMAARLSTIPVPEPLPARLKLAVAGCRRCCTMPRLRDIGLLPSAKGWSLSFGGNGGASPRIGDIIGSELSDSLALDMISSCLLQYQRLGEPGERTSRFMERVGITTFLKKIQKN